MHTAILYIVVSIAIVIGSNIIIEHDPLHCDPAMPGLEGCLRGQHCTLHGT